MKVDVNGVKQVRGANKEHKVIKSDFQKGRVGGDVDGNQEILPFAGLWSVVVLRGKRGNGKQEG